MMESLVDSCSKISYWKNKLEGATQVVPYPMVLEGDNQLYTIQQIQIEIDPATSEKILAVAKGKDLNIYKLFMAGLSIVLSKYSLYNDLLITTSNFNFDDQSLKQTPALLFFKLMMEEDDSIKELLDKIHGELTESYSNQEYEYFRFKEEELSDQYLTDLISGIGFYYDQLNAWIPDFEQIACLLKLTRESDRLYLSIDYHDSRYTENGAALLGAHIVRALALLADDFTQKISDVNFITEQDKYHFFHDFNDTKVTYEPIPVLHQFEDQVIKTPNAIAVKSGAVELTYKQLNEKANCVANYLLTEQGLKPQDKVALMVDRSEKIIIGILAILKAEGVYIPIDLSAPEDRINFFLADSGCVAVLTEDRYLKNTDDDEPIYLSIDQQLSDNDTNPENGTKPGDLAYVIYTSGTTGRPKGAMVFQGSLTNHVNWFKRQFSLTEEDSTMLINSYSFDGCYSYTWATITSGGTLHIPNDSIFDPDSTLEYIKNEGVTFLKLVPSTFGVLVNSETFDADPTVCQSIRMIKQGGETINVNNLRKYFEKYPEVILGNHYGATECTIGSVAYWITADTIDDFAKQPVLGAPFDNQQVYVLGNQNQLLPVGVFGEICIGGDCVGNGYLNRPELNEKKFIENPFGGSEKLYKTGDQGRWLPSGNLEFAGRLDNQVKVRGYRVELDEISEAVKEFASVRDAIALVHKEDEQDFLALWFIADESILKGDVEAFMKSKLPPYMLPHYYVQLDRIPLTPNGKIDKKALPNPNEFQIQDEKEIEGPENITEQALLDIWKGLLGDKPISTSDNFFEIGGHSLKATQMIARIHKQFDVKIPLRDVFIKPTISALAAIIGTSAIEEEYADITPIEEQPFYDLSHAQKRMWVTYLLQEDKTIYNIPHSIRLKGTVDQKAFQQAFKALVKRHEILRTLFVSVEGEPKQKVLTNEEANFEMRYEDLTASDQTEAEAAKIAEAEANTVFILEEKPALSACLLKVAAKEYVLLFTLHHIISDGWSTQVFTNELLANYQSFKNDDKDQQAPLKIQYKDFAHWQNNLLQDENIASHKLYWNEKFAGELSALDLPTDQSRTALRTFQGATKTIHLDENIANQLAELAAEKESTLFMVLMSFVKILLYRYTGQEDVIIGTPIAGREHADLANQIGFYVNTLAIRSAIKGDQSFDQTIAHVKDNLLSAYQHQAYPFDKLLEDLNIVSEKGRSPLFDVMMVMQNNVPSRDEQFEASGLQYSDYESAYEISKFDLTFCFGELTNGLSMGIEYSTELFSEAKVDRMLMHLENIISTCLSNPSTQINGFNYLSKEELNEITALNGEVDESLSSRTVIEIFKEQVEARADFPALVGENTSYSYKELGEQTDKIATFLFSRHEVLHGDVVAVICEDKGNFIANMLGVLKAGAAYLPLEANVPIDRIRQLMEATEAKLILTDSTTVKDKINGEFDVTFLSEIATSTEELQVNEQLNSEITPASLAYIIFTSGTTGRPKGVMINHQNIVRLVTHTNYTDFSKEDKILQGGSLSFDAATFEIWGPLLNGGEVHVADTADLLNAHHLADVLQERKINKMFFTTAWFNQLADMDPNIFNSLSQLLVGGEKLSPFHIGKVRDACPNLLLTNVYGPTENTTFSTAGDIIDECLDEIPLGQTISSSSVHILDNQLQPVPKGIKGEMYLGGVGLSKGYINDPINTADKFIASPFAEGEILYKSGDLGKWLEDGRISFQGRVDDQVKIRGYRIEPSEIEVMMQSHDLINQAEVLVKVTDEGEKVLIGYYTACEELEPDILRVFLKISLPNYMIPSALIRMDEMPLNKNGKVDKKNLPMPDFTSLLDQEYEAPSNQIEYKLVALYGELLSLNTDLISVAANFFELGGHSLKATMLAGKIVKEFGVEISVKTIFSVDSIRDLAIYIDKAEAVHIAPILKAPDMVFYPVTPAQSRLYALHQFDPSSLAYNVPNVMDLTEDYTIEEVLEACNEIVKRHDSLRTSFTMFNDELMQKIRPEMDLQLEEFTGLTEAEAKVKFVRPFDLKNGPLLRLGVVRNAGQDLLLVDMHHIIVDGLSQSIIIDELERILTGDTLLPVTYQYKDYALWVSEPKQQQLFAAQKEYWTDKYEEEVPELSLPFDFQRGSVKGFKGRAVQFTLSQDNVDFLKGLSRKKGTTLYMNVLAIWTVLLSKISGKEDLSIGTPVAGRMHPNLEKVVGMFVNTLALRFKPNGQMNFLEYLGEVKNSVFKDFEHQAYPFEKLVEEIWDKRDPSRNPVFDTMYGLLSKEEFGVDMEIEEGQIVFDEEETFSKFDLNFRLLDLGEGIGCNLTYSTSLFKQETITQLINQFNGLIDQLRTDVEVSISSIEIISAIEKETLLVKANKTETVFDKEDLTIDQLFEEQTLRFPKKVAVVDREGALTLQELSDRSSHLAAQLVKNGAVSNDLVGVLLPPTKDIMTAILGAFKAGCAYVPIDADIPTERINHILADSGIKYLVSTNDLASQLDFKGEVLDILQLDMEKSIDKNTLPVNKPDNLAYVIYTSGSTGKPKGVPIKQYQIVDYVNWFLNDLAYDHQDSTALVSSFSFDVGHSAIFPSIAAGAALHILRKDEYLSVENLGNYISKNEITFMKFTPTLFSVLINDSRFESRWLESVNHVMLGGEAVITEDLNTFFEFYPEKKVINSYGPTEVTVAGITKLITRQNLTSFMEKPVIGQPMSNMKVYVLDQYLNPLPTGATGQIYLAGKGISAGYIGQPELTKEKFIESPFENDQVLYATGDLGSWTHDREIAFKGRMDDQVKIRGYRVELEEVGNVIKGFDNVQKVCVLVKTLEDGDQSIIAFIEGKDQLDVNQLRNYLEQGLPAYMVPSFLVPIEQMPMTPNGKMDRQELLKYPLHNYLTADSEPPSNEMEANLLELWGTVLGVAVHDVNANFFKLGGHSLKALKVANHIEQNWELKVPLKVFFSTPTVKGLAKFINTLEKRSYKRIEVAKEATHYPLSHAQKRLWLLQEFSENKSAYNVPRIYQLKGKVNAENLQRAFEQTISRHEILRTVFKIVDGEPRQFIKNETSYPAYFSVEEFHLSGKEEIAYLSGLTNYVFDLQNGPLIKVTLLKQCESESLLVINLHHIISDGWSAGILLEELCERYNALSRNEVIVKDLLPIQYKDYSVWQTNQLEDENQKEHLDFWRNKLSGELTRFTLPETFPRTAKNQTKGQTLNYRMSGGLVDLLEQAAIDNQSSLYMVLLSALNALFYRYTGQEDILIGTVVAGREREELNEQLGFYVNTVPQRFKLNGEQSFGDLLQTVKEEFLATQEHHFYPFDLIVSNLGFVQEGNRSPLFDVMFVHQNNEDPEDYQLTLNGLEIEDVSESLSESKFDISFVTRRSGNDLNVFVEYNANIYSEQFLSGFLQNFEDLLKSITVDFQQKINHIDYLAKEQQLLLNSFNETNIVKEYTSIQDNFENAVKQNGNRIALINGELTMTYDQLNEQVNQLAHWMTTHYDISKDQIIAFSLERSEWQIISLLAILKTGAAFLPIDVKLPEKRKEYIVENAEPLFVLTDNEREETEGIRLESLSEIKSQLSGYSSENPINQTKENDLAYVIYTSGSTGKPKGVMVEHRGNINMVTDQIRQFKITNEDRCLQFASVSFDASVYEIFIGLYAGSAIVLLTNEIIGNPTTFTNYLNEKKVTFATLPPVYLSGLDNEKLTNLKVLVTAGESPNAKDAQYLSNHLAYYNAYGPTEFSVCASVYRVAGNEKVVPIGKPLDNSQIYILDQQMNQMPVGTWGELHLAGKGIARGYIKRPTENKAKFITNPFETESKIYKTGDIGRWLPDGNIEFKGREDDMLKIRGYRIEVAEIEYAILEHPSVHEAVIKYDEERKILLAYIVGENDTETFDLKAFVSERIPTYMVPSFFCNVESIPLTTNGKVDFKALPIISNELRNDREITLPINEIEEQVLQLWAEVLGLKTNYISTKDNFFEIGGQSILVMKLIAKVWDTFQKDLSLRDFLKDPTIQAIAAQIQNEGVEKGLIVPLNQLEESNAKLFMVSPVLGSSIVFQNLAEKLKQNQVACYGIQYRGFDYEEAFDESLEVMAISTLNEMKPFISKHEKINIMGYSMGALVAAETTSLLEKEGYQVNLVLVDRSPENVLSAVTANQTEIGDEELVDELIANHLQGIEILTHNHTRIRNLLKHNIQILEAYEFNKQLKADILAIEAEETATQNKMKSWSHLTDGSFIHQTMKGDHFTMMSEPNTFELFQIINTIIKKHS